MAGSSSGTNIFQQGWDFLKDAGGTWFEWENQQDQREHQQWLEKQQQTVAPTASGWTTDMQKMWSDQSETTKHLVKYMGYMTAVFAVLGVGYLVINKKK